ncbi:two-component regulator propeller domain-containing protein [Sporocytophaga myxococcoides]|uniref:two-component regulator propeller domain-containing protein n=1 Tax=Sporocytophaga myxococcoides TaxID=153721 RepID=UPI000426A75F|nr:two-component regulator propeller domain-containing protein [Sporocytophaga myxococcoides]
MKATYPILILILLLLFSGNAVFSQQYNFQNFSVEDGLAQSQVYSICEDNNGNIWFGTRGGGLSRFDGINFSNITVQDGLSNNYVRTILKDNLGNLWIGTDNGLSKYDGFKFINYTEKQGLYNTTVNALIKDRKGTVWIGTADGLFHFEKDTIVRFGRKLNAPRSKINCLFEDKSGTIWAGTDFGIFKFLENHGKYEMQQISILDGLAGNQITSIKQDSLSRIWVCTYSGGVSVISNGNIKNFSKAQGLPGNTIYDCLAADSNTVWLCTSNGIARLAEESGQISAKNITEAEGLANNVVMSMYKDSFGNIWFGTSGGGISKLGSERFIHYKAIKGIFGNWVYSIYEDRQGCMWFGTSEGGVTKYDGRIFKRFSERNDFTASKVKYICEDNKGNLWMGTIADGVYLFNGKSFRGFNRKSGLGSNFINYILCDTSGLIWLATAGGGIDCLIPYRNTFKVKHITKKDGLSGDRYNTLIKDNSGTIWAGSTDNGLSKIELNGNLEFEITNYEVTDGIRSNSIRCSARDSTGNLYFGTADAGIVKYQKGKFSFINISHGLTSNNIYSLIFDNEGSLWAGSEKGIDRIVLDEHSAVKGVRHFGKAEGFVGIETIQNAVCKDHEGNIWFGSIKSATVFNNSKELPVKRPLVHITGMNLFYNEIENTPFVKKLLKWYPVPEDLVLPYDQNHLTFEFIGIEQVNPEAVQYKWKLSGFDHDWSPASQKREAVYSNLPAGDYIFEVVAANELGHWSGVPAKFHFVINPPFWKTWWFTLIILIALTIVLWLATRYALSRLHEQNERERLKLETDRNLLELEQKALRLQMNPHFLFNCLNSIKGLIAEGKNNEAKIYLSKFSKLMRTMLDNSMDSIVSLENEIASLQNYVELEKLSREDRFEFKVEVEDLIDKEFTGLPPMLIQPFVENAIIHGLSVKLTKGLVVVLFNMEGEYLKCSIEDNGVGREKAKMLEDESITKHKSAAISVTQERLNILNRNLNQKETKILITDLKDQNDQPSGTRVELFIPFQQL